MTQPWIYSTEFFTKEELGKMVNLQDGLEFSSGNIEDQTLKKQTRNSSVGWISAEDKNKWVYERILKCLEEGMKYFKIDCNKLEKLQYSIYYKGCFYGWHSDRTGETNRLLSLGIQLTDKDEFEGGTFQFYNSGEVYSIPSEYGQTVIFPSDTIHQVTKIKVGEKRTIVSWSGQY